MKALFGGAAQLGAALTQRGAEPYCQFAFCLERKVKILVIGSGGREHALVWKLKQSPRVEKLWCAPGNGGISSDAECVKVDLEDAQAMANLAKGLKADLTVVGPELPLALGVADEFAKRGILALGPGAAGARLESSKVFAKEFMQRHRIPTAAVYGVFEHAVDAYAALCEVDWPLVIKADGLCAGKGVLVTSSPDEATSFVERILEEREFGDAGKKILLEEGLTGRELSYIVLTDGERFVPFAPARDHKRVHDGDQGPNTGGMGAYSTDELLSPQLETAVKDTIVRPTLKGLAEDGIPYRGFLYFGLMLTELGPRVLEFNCRLGDPETQAILLRADFDLAELLLAAANRDLREESWHWKPRASLCVVLAGRGYPGKPEVNKEIVGLKEAQGVQGIQLFHGGVRRDGYKYYTSGGRILAVCSSGESLGAARGLVYDVLSNITFEGMHFRSDIGFPEGASAWAAGERQAG